MFRDLEVDHEWGILLSNLELFGVLSVHTVQGEIVPNIFMPPLYPLFLYLIKIFLIILILSYGLFNLRNFSQSHYYLLDL